MSRTSKHRINVKNEQLRRSKRIQMRMGKVKIQAKENKSGKRHEYLSWGAYFMAVAFLSGQRSKDPRTQVGACIVNKDKRIVSTGYNGMPNSCSDDDLPWEREEGTLKNKHLYVCHAEMNAVVNTFSESLKGCTMYVSLFPCNECTKIIIQAGITEIWYYSDKKKGDPKDKASRKMLRMAKVKIRKFPRRTESIEIDFNVNENS